MVFDYSLIFAIWISTLRNTVDKRPSVTKMIFFPIQEASSVSTKVANNLATKVKENLLFNVEKHSKTSKLESVSEGRQYSFLVRIGKKEANKNTIQVEIYYHLVRFFVYWLINN